MRAAARLSVIKEGWPEKQGDLYDALTYNRKLWTVFLNSMSDENCPLPQEIRNNIASLAMFVMNHTLQCIAIEEPRKLEVLINLNRSIAMGLRGGAKAAG